MHDSFEIVSLEGKVAVYYYKDGTLTVEGDDGDAFFRRIVRQVNKMISRKDYL
jgi:ribonuclease HIII